MDHALLASEFLRALRGKHSQNSFSRRCGYRSNIASRWERGVCFPTASQAFHVAERVRIDVHASLARFFRTPPPWLETADLSSAEGVAMLLRELRSGIAFIDVARELGVNRFSVARWFSGAAEPKLSEFLALVDVLSLRLVDFISVFVDPASVPCLQEDVARHRAAREAAFHRPWSHAVLRMLEIKSYEKLQQHQEGFIAERLGIAVAEERACLETLIRAGQVQHVDGRYQPTQLENIDMRNETQGLRALKTFWLDVAKQRLTSGQEGVFGYNLFAVTERDLAEIRDLYFDLYKRVQAIVARSAPSECIALWSTQLMRLDRP